MKLALWITLSIVLSSMISFMLAVILSSKFRNDMLVGSGEAKVLGFLSVKGASMILMQVVLLGSAIYIDNLIGKTPPAKESMAEPEKIIRAYFSDLNRGLAGEREAFLRCWDELSIAEQEKRKQKFPKLDLPNEYDLLYRQSGNHYLQSISKIAGDEHSEELVYFVVYRTREPHFVNPLYERFCPSTKDRLEDSCNVLELEEVKASLLGRLRLYYDVEQAAQEKNMPVDDLLNHVFEESVKKNYLNKIISPRLLTELAAAYRLQPRKPTPGVSQDTGRLYEVYQGDRIHVVRTSKGWKINEWASASLYTYPTTS